MCFAFKKPCVQGESWEKEKKKKDYSIMCYYRGDKGIIFSMNIKSNTELRLLGRGKFRTDI